jgi:hypothetical protein
MKKYSLLITLLLPLVSLGQWQAEMTSSISGGETHYTVYSDLTKYRYEFTQDNMNGVVIADPEANVTAIMLVDDRKVHYTATDGMMSRMNDPVQAYNSYKVYGEEKVIGNEEMNGYSCIKKAIFDGEKELFTQWYAEKLNFPVKLIGHWAENTYMELENIRAWEADPAMFKVPEDYIEVDDQLRPVIPEPPPPDAWETSESAVPVDMEVSRGMLIEIPIDETVYHRFIVENTGDTPAKFRFHIFMDGKELPEDRQGPEDFRTRRLHMGEDYKMTHDWKEGYMIKVKVYEGSAQLKIHKE